MRGSVATEREYFGFFFVVKDLNFRAGETFSIVIILRYYYFSFVLRGWMRYQCSPHPLIGEGIPPSASRFYVRPGFFVFPFHIFITLRGSVATERIFFQFETSKLYISEHYLGTIIICNAIIIMNFLILGKI